MQTIFIAMPTSGHVKTETMTSLIDLTQSLHKRGVGFAVKTFQGSDIVMSRNALMSQFLKESIFTHTLLLDSDMSFHPDVVFRLLDFEAEFTCAAYPQRSLQLDRFRKLVEEDSSLPTKDRRTTADLEAASLTYNVQRGLHSGTEFISSERDGFRTVAGAGTGLMLISRTVPETMIKTGAAPRRSRHDKLPLYANSKFYDFFSHLTSHNADLMYGEDQSFCRRWIETCGGEIWCDTTSVVTHHGDFPFRGDFSKRR